MSVERFKTKDKSKKTKVKMSVERFKTKDKSKKTKVKMSGESRVVNGIR